MQLGAGLAVTLPPADGLAAVVRVKHCRAKIAVTVRLAVILTVTGFVVPLASPLQPTKV